LSPVTSVSHSCGAFYSFVEVPPALGLTGTQFCDRLIEHNVVTIPGGVFSSRDTHFRISFACDDQKLEEGLQIIRQSMQPATV
jgi:aspartate/methionine/tyrosine aminotransferase